MTRLNGLHRVRTKFIAQRLAAEVVRAHYFLSFAE